MKLKFSSKGTYKVITIFDPLKIISDLTELRTIVEKYLQKNEKYIAIDFSDTSYLYSGAVSVLITCYRKIKEQGGNLCIIKPHKKILELMMQMNIDNLIDIYHSKEDLLGKSFHKQKA